MIDINVNYVLEILRDVDSCEVFAPAWGAAGKNLEKLLINVMD